MQSMGVPIASARQEIAMTNVAAEPPEFRIGLCMAGAISGGAYAAGVVDFLLEALEEWEKARKSGDANVATHRVKIAAMAGASAGGMVTAITCRALATGIEPVRDPLRHRSEDLAADPERQTAPYRNPLFAAWVENIDIRHLLTARDLADEKASVASALDSTVLEQICRNVLHWSDAKRPAAPPYITDPLDVYFTTTNLRGVAYGIPLTGTTQGYRHMMTVHADYSRFRLTWQPSSPAATPEEKDARSALRLDPALLADKGNWHELTTAALASGAFPIGLRPHRLERKAAVYHERVWKVPRANPLRYGADETPVSEDLAEEQDILNNKKEIIRALATRNRAIDPVWPPGIADLKDSWDYAYWNVDGGVMNNEPMEYVRRALAGSGGRNERSGAAATAAVLMIDPFPNESPLTPQYPETIGLIKVVTGLFSALIAQARFKPEDLALALDETVFSRYVIFPSYSERGANIHEPAMCAATLGGFGGFLSEAFRRHDYALGRRNCQQFLRRHFALLESNPVVSGFPSKEDACLKEADGTPELYGKSSSYFDRDGVPLISQTDPHLGERLMPIIPLYGTAAEPIPLPPRPTSGDVDREALRKAITARLEAVVPRLIADLPNGLLRLLMRIIWHGAWLVGQRGKIVDAIMDKIDASITTLDR
jgi:hypothetical protein